MGREEIIEEPKITMGLFVQPDIIKSFPNSFNGRGLLARFLYSIPNSIVGKRKIRPKPIEGNILDKYINTVLKLCEFSPSDTIHLQYDTEADSILQAMQLDNEIKLREDGELSDIPDWGGKLMGQIVRVTGLLHLAEVFGENEKLNGGDIPRMIKVSTVSKCSKLINYLSEHAKSTFGCMKIDQRVEDAKYLLKVILNKRSDVILYRDIQQLTKKRFPTTDTLKSTLSFLEGRELIKLIQSNKKYIIHVNPQLLDNNKSTPVTPKVID